MIIINIDGWMNGKKEVFYLTKHTLHFFYGFMALDIKKDHSYNKRKKHFKQQCLFYMHHPTDRIVHIATFVIPVVQNKLEL